MGLLQVCYVANGADLSKSLNKVGRQIALTIQARVPFIAGALGCEVAQFVCGAFEHGCTVRVRAGSSAHIRSQHVTDARQRVSRIDRLGGKDFSAAGLSIKSSSRNLSEPVPAMRT